MTANKRNEVTGIVPEALQPALRHGVLKRVPLTFLPFVNQQLREWAYLFPNERGSTERLLLYVDGLNDDGSRTLFRDVVALEDKMGVRGWQFSTTEQTIQNASQLARSPYFLEWRAAVQAVFDAADRNSPRLEAERTRHRLIAIEIPGALPVNATRVWKRWQGMGRVLRLEKETGSLGRSCLESVLESCLGTVLDAIGDDGRGEIDRPPGTEDAATERWVIDAGEGLANHRAGKWDKAVRLSYTRLANYRENFSHEMNTMRKDLVDADAVFDRLRKVDVTPWCPPEIAVDPTVREFVRSLYLSGNGAVIFGNSFVEWAASEALRRARPTLLAARFGVRSKPKPFTGVAVFENPDEVNPLPAVEDAEGSALDAEMLALYVWLAASRLDEYQRETVCVCFAESIAEAYLISPREFSFSSTDAPISMDRLSHALAEWMA